MDAFSAGIDALFTDPNIARGATWRAGGAGDGAAVRIVTRKPDQTGGFGDSRAIMPTMLIDVRPSEIPNPASGDTFEIDGVMFEVIATPMAGSLGLVWTCEAASPA